MTTAVLLLNADYSPIKVIPWERALYLIIDQKATLLADYAGKVIRSANLEMAWPAVVALKHYVRSPHKIRFNRSNVLARDVYVCQYCGDRPRTRSGSPLLEELTIDHVVPRAQSKKGHVILPWNGARVAVTCWENIVTACHTCNAKKADRTPAQAKMTLKTLPKKPSAWDAVRMSVIRTKIPDEWRLFIPDDSAWRDYWDIELDAD